MAKPLVILIAGLPCTGKTTLGKRLAKEFSLPFISKDDIKESLFNTLGWQDREWSKKIGAASYEILYYLAESLFESQTSFIIESNFKPEFDTVRFQTYIKKYDFQVLQVLCKTEGEILFERFKVRSESGERHPGHVDHLNYEEFKQTLLHGRQTQLDITGSFLQIDTTNFATIDYDQIYAEIRKNIT